jgi:hypothetical protein
MVRKDKSQAKAKFPNMAFLKPKAKSAGTL